MNKFMRTKKHKKNSTIQQHKKIGKKLIAPMMSLPGLNLSFTSWMNGMLAEMLWVCLVINTIPRLKALMIFKSIASLGFKYRNSQHDFSKWDLTQTSLAILPDYIFLNLIKIVTKHPLGYAALRPLLLIDSLPNKERWLSALQTEPQLEDWQTLSRAVANTLNHQSQASTDIRWLIIMFKAALGLISVSPHLAEKMKCIVEYPNRGNMASVCSSIRSWELSFRSDSEKK